MSKRVLVVECRIARQEMISKSLNDEGYAVTTACDGDWALIAWHSMGHDLVVVGEFMGSRISTAEALVEAIREIDPGQPLVILTPATTPR